jgi:hypothetical protein
MGNSPEIIKRHYDARALPKDAEKYWSITPEMSAKLKSQTAPL